MALHFLNEGSIIDDAGNLISVWYLDMRNPDWRVPIRTLIKAGRKQYAMGTLGTMRVSKPARFRNSGEGLIMDPTETLVSRSIKKSESIDTAELEQAREFAEEVRRCAAAIRAHAWTTRLPTQDRTQKKTISLTLGKNGWIYSTSIEPAEDEDGYRLLASMPTEYDHVERIHRPREFARALGLMVAEQLGPRCKEATVNSTFGNKRFESKHRNEMIVHGPVVYTANAFDLAAGAASEGERTFLPVFAQDIRYADQREYRFAIWTEEEPAQKYVDLTVSKAMFGSLKEWAGVTVGAVGSLPRETDAPPAAPRAPETRGQIRDGTVRTGVQSSLFRDGSIHFPHEHNPTATPVAPSTPARGEIDNAVAEATAAAVAALRYKVEQVSGERRVRVAAAAWHAEPWIRALCSSYEDPISGIWINEDDILVVDLKLPPEMDASAKIGFGPSGARVYGLDHVGGQTTSSSSRDSDPFGPDMLLRTLDELGVRQRRADQ